MPVKRAEAPRSSNQVFRMLRLLRLMTMGYKQPDFSNLPLNLLTTESSNP
jgi:hypothetical protein